MSSDVQVKEDTWYLWIVGVCVGTFIILVTMAILGPYFMWKHRVILVMKIVHYFQAYEDDGKIREKLACLPAILVPVMFSQYVLECLYT